MSHIITDIPNHEIPLNIEGTRNFLRSHQFPEGFIEHFINNEEHVPIRFFICDDSGSMFESDGNRLIPTPGRHGGMKSVPCSRWEELRDSINFHAELASASNSLTEFRFLNGPPSIVVGDFERDPDGCGLRAVKKVLEGGPQGGTPLCAHIRAIIDQIKTAEVRLRNNNQVACVTICTDGMCSDGNLVLAMKPLEKLPCWVVVKLCTDDDKIVEYWNNVDGELELEMDVLDDFAAEAKEIYDLNPWITYGLPFHRLREWGLKNLKEADMMDERALTANQMVNILCMMFNLQPRDLPNPQGDAREFKRAIKQHLPGLPKVYNPITERVDPWIDYSSICSAYSLPRGGCSIS